jgi:hypothetical protein
MMLQEEEANGEHGIEHAAWIAIATPQDTNSSDISTYTTDHSITHRRSTLSFNANPETTTVFLASDRSCVVAKDRLRSSGPLDIISFPRRSRCPF